MPIWWSRLLQRFSRCDPCRTSAQAKLQLAAEDILRASRHNYDLPDESAARKSMALLDRALTAEQRRDLATRGCFLVKGNRFTYRIRLGHSGNVDAMDPSGRVISRWCAHPLGHAPIHDVMLAQKLWIETDEEMFLRRAARLPTF